MFSCHSKLILGKLNLFLFLTYSPIIPFTLFPPLSVLDTRIIVTPVVGQVAANNICIVDNQWQEQTLGSDVEISILVMDDDLTKYKLKIS